MEDNICERSQGILWQLRDRLLKGKEEFARIYHANGSAYISLELSSEFIGLEDCIGHIVFNEFVPAMRGLFEYDDLERIELKHDGPFRTNIVIFLRKQT